MISYGVMYVGSSAIRGTVPYANNSIRGTVRRTGPRNSTAQNNLNSENNTVVNNRGLINRSDRTSQYDPSQNNTGLNNSRYYSNTEIEPTYQGISNANVRKADLTGTGMDIMI